MAHRVEIWQRGVMVTSAEAADRRTALETIARYASQFKQDGPIKIKERRIDQEPPVQNRTD